MQKLVQGVHRFQQDVVPTQRDLFHGLGKGQSPQALFITCSDSRILPNLLTQTEPGELFILRNAGNIVPVHGAVAGGEAATIEYAVAGLGVEHIVVCGHSHCGAMNALMSPSSVDSMPSVKQWIGHAETTRRIVLENYADRSPDDLLSVAIQENVLCQLENLRTHPAVAARLASGKLQLHAWVYKITTGEVFAYDSREGQFRPLADVDGVAKASPRLLSNALLAL